MLVAVVTVGEVCVRVGALLVGVLVLVAPFRTGFGTGQVLMLMMVVVGVPVVMGDCDVSVLVLVPLGEVQPDPQAYQGSGDDQWPGERVAQNERQDGPEERRHAVVGTGAGSADMPQRDDEQHEADPVGEESDE